MTLPEKNKPPDVDDRLEEEIRLRAYYRFLARGPADGNDVDDWLRAAEELRDGGKSKGDDSIEGSKAE